MADGIAIPERLEELTPDWLTQVLGRERLGDARVSKVACERLGEGEGFVGQLARLHLELDGTAPDAPRTLIAKLPTTVTANRATGEMLGAFEREVLFYREMSDEVGYRTARLYHADMDENPGSKYGPAIVRFLDRLPRFLLAILMGVFLWLAGKSRRRYVLLLEDLAPAKLGDQLAGRPVEDCLPVVRGMARAQAPHWRSPVLAERYWVANLDIGLHMTQQAFRGSRSGFEERFAATLRSDDREAIAWLDANGVRLMEALHAQAPATLVHGDFRLDNLFFDGSGDPIVVDWQGIAFGPGVMDLAYFASGTLLPETLPEAELSLVRAYHEALVGAGVSDYGLDACLRDYRRCMLLCLHRIVTVDMIDFGDERGRSLVDLWVERVLARVRGIDRDALL